MKNSIYTTFLTLTALIFASCCGVVPCDKTQTVSQTITEMQETTETSSKGGSYVVSTPVETTVDVEQATPDCLSVYYPTPTNCGSSSEVVLNRASAQGWDGNPSIGLVPTMKVLAE